MDLSSLPAPRKSGKTKKKRYIILFGLLALVAVLGALAAYTARHGHLPGFSRIKVDNTAAAYEELEVTFIDVGQGLSVLAVCEGKTLLYDGGGPGASSRLVAYLKERGIKKIDYMIASHYDADHIAGLIGVLNTCEVEKVFGPGYVREGRIFESFTGTCAARGIPVEQPELYQSFSLGGASFECLWPERISENDNENSLVIKIIHGDNSFLLTGDLGIESENSMINKRIDLSADVLQAAHHGSGGSTGWEFLTKVLPEAAVISCGKDNDYGHPHAETIERLEAADVRLFRTDLQGDITVISNKKELRYSTQPSTDHSAGNEDGGDKMPDYKILH